MKKNNFKVVKIDKNKNLLNYEKKNSLKLIRNYIKK